MNQGRIAQYWVENPRIQQFVEGMRSEWSSLDYCEMQRRISRKFGYGKRPTLPALMAAMKGNWTGRRTDRDEPGAAGREIATAAERPRNDAETVERLMATADVAGECRIKGMKRLSGRSCLMSQCGSRYRRYLRLDAYFGGERGDEHLHQRFLACRECVHWLDDAEYRRGVELLRAQRPFGDNYRGALRRDVPGRTSSW